MMEKVPMTAGGYAALEVELKKRQSEDRPRIIEHIAEARSHGDLSENAEYHAAKEEQSHNEGRIAELERKIGQLTMENDFLKKALQHFRDHHPPAVVSGEVACLRKSARPRKLAKGKL